MFIVGAQVRELNLKMSKCKFCKKPATNKFGLNYYCDAECAYKQARANQIKKIDKDASERRKRDREKLKQLKSRSEWLKELQVIFNRFIRLRDAGLPCISCGHPDDGSRQRHASHYKSVGGNPALRFDPNNCFASCSICNNYLSGNLVPYRVALIAKVGQSEVDRLEGKQEALKLTIPEIQVLIVEYKAKVKALTGQSSV
jgi:5-methylcytosine-specific restriction endonuclease McrA